MTCRLTSDISTKEFHHYFPVATHIGGSQMLDLLGKIAHESMDGTKRNIEKLKRNNSDDGIVQANGQM
jgi:hypothetical protein